VKDEPFLFDPRWADFIPQQHELVAEPQERVVQEVFNFEQEVHHETYRVSKGVT
jgi:hypothetical protein